MKPALLIAGLACVMAVAPIAVAADASANSAKPADSDKPPLQDLQVDFSIPDSPAFTVLGINPTNISHPSTPRALALALASGLDESGKLKQGLALEFAPFRIADPSRQLRDTIVQANGGKPSMPYAFQNASLSLATAKGQSDDDKSTRLGLGLKVPIFDDSDPRTDLALVTCYDDKVKDLWLEGRSKGTKKEELDKQVTEAAKKCYDERPSKRWNASAWAVSLGAAWTSDSGSFSDHKTTTRGVWTTYAYGFELLTPSQILVHLRAIDKERVADPTQTGKFTNQDSRVAALELKLGSDRFHGLLQGSYTRAKRENAADTDKIRRLAVGLEFAVAKNVWLVASVGGEGGRTNGDNKSFVLTTLRFDPMSKPIYSPAD